MKDGRETGGKNVVGKMQGLVEVSARSILSEDKSGRFGAFEGSDVAMLDGVPNKREVFNSVNHLRGFAIVMVHQSYPVVDCQVDISGLALFLQIHEHFIWRCHSFVL